MLALTKLGSSVFSSRSSSVKSFIFSGRTSNPVRFRRYSYGLPSLSVITATFLLNSLTRLMYSLNATPPTTISSMPSLKGCFFHNACNSSK